LSNVLDYCCIAILLPALFCGADDGLERLIL
jgi:hypothetical protein